MWSIKNEQIKKNHSQSKTRKTLAESNIRIYNILNSIFDQIDEIMKRYINIYHKKYEHYSVRYVLKLLTITNRVGFIRIITRLKLGYFFNFSKIR